MDALMTCTKILHNYRRPLAARAKSRRTVGPYRWTPREVDKAEGRGFYLDEYGDGAMGMRWKWAHDVIRLGHTGWFCDEFEDQTIAGIVIVLPHGRGWLAGWSMGERMASSLDYHIYANERNAAYAADSMARQVAEDERVYQAEERERMEAEEERERELDALMVHEEETHA